MATRFQKHIASGINDIRCAWLILVEIELLQTVMFSNISSYFILDLCFYPDMVLTNHPSSPFCSQKRIAS